MATSVTNFVLLLSVTICSYQISRIKEAYFLQDDGASDGYAIEPIIEYWNVALPATVMLCADLWAINVIIIILSGILGVEDQATAVITYSIVLQFITFAHGTQDGACTLIKHQLC